MTVGSLAFVWNGARYAFAFDRENGITPDFKDESAMWWTTGSLAVYLISNLILYSNKEFREDMERQKKARKFVRGY